MKQKKIRGIESLKSMYGRLFLAPWLFGLVVFMLIPLVQSVIFSFSKVSVVPGGIDISFVKLENFDFAWREDADFVNILKSSLSSMIYKFPLTVFLSMFLAVILNQEFKGRTFFRTVYFLPVIIATGVVLNLIMGSKSQDMQALGTTTSIAENMIKIDDMLRLLSLPDKLSDVISSSVNALINLIWDTGIQTVLFISGMQSIPELLYEVSKVEGANRWQEFWFITFPLLLRVMMIVAIFTLIEISTSPTNAVMSYAYQYIGSQAFGVGSALLWSYFIFIGALLAILFLMYGKANKRWE